MVRAVPGGAADHGVGEVEERPAQRRRVPGLARGKREHGGQRDRVGQQGERPPRRADLDRDQVTARHGGQVDLVDHRNRRAQPVEDQHALITPGQHRADRHPRSQQRPQPFCRASVAEVRRDDGHHRRPGRALSIRRRSGASMAGVAGSRRDLTCPDSWRDTACLAERRDTACLAERRHANAPRWRGDGVCPSKWRGGTCPGGRQRAIQPQRHAGPGAGAAGRGDPGGDQPQPAGGGRRRGDGQRRGIHRPERRDPRLGNPAPQAPFQPPHQRGGRAE